MSDPPEQIYLRLETRDGEFLTNVRIPRPFILPEIVMWSGRMFVSRNRKVEGVSLYHEAVSVTVVDPTPSGQTIIPVTES